MQSSRGIDLRDRKISRLWARWRGWAGVEIRKNHWAPECVESLRFAHKAIVEALLQWGLSPRDIARTGLDDPRLEVQDREVLLKDYLNAKDKHWARKRAAGPRARAEADLPLVQD